METYFIASLKLMFIYRLYKNIFSLNNKFYNYFDKYRKSFVSNSIITKLIIKV